jgi:hypothetical protein
MQHLPIYLNWMRVDAAGRGDFTTARAVITETDAILNATGADLTPTAAVLLASLRGREADAISLITAAQPLPAIRGSPNEDWASRFGQSVTDHRRPLQ